MDRVVDLYLNEPATRKRWEAFLSQLDIHNFSDREIDVIDHTLGLLDEDGKLVGTGSIAGNVLKYIAVCNKDAVVGARFNKIVTALQQYLFNERIFHSFVFTKLKYSSSFQHLGFTELAHSDQAAFLESGTPNVEDYLDELPKIADQANKKVTAVVMNANPFTLGHLHLVEEASKSNDLVYVFVVATDLSLFNSQERLKLVQAGLKQLKNVVVVSGEDYMVSSATFPAYFLQSPEDLIQTQTTIDARVFKNIIAPKLNISSRFLGEEPKSHTTSIYNLVLKKELEPSIAVKIIPRLELGGELITATQIRREIKAGNLDQIKSFVPETTFEFIENNLAELQQRIKEGMNINGN